MRRTCYQIGNSFRIFPYGGPASYKAARAWRLLVPGGSVVIVLICLGG